MGKLAEWCAGQPAWAVDALQRVAGATSIQSHDVDALVDRIGLAHGLSVQGERSLLAFVEGDVVSSATRPDDVLLHSIGPMAGLDRLAPGQVLKFAIDGITVVFGDNGAGKSGYTRALRQLCSARLEPVLQGDAFSTTADPTKTIAYTCQQGSADPYTLTWTEGDPKPAVLSGVTLLDADNLRVYVEGKNEILYLPPEAECIVRLAELYQAAASRYRASIDQITVRCSPAFGGHYQGTTTAGRLIGRLQFTTPQTNLPTEAEIRQAAVWTSEQEAEIGRLGAELVQGPAAVANYYDRIAGACNAAAQALDANAPSLSSPVIDADGVLIRDQQSKRQIADTLVAQQIGAQPIRATGTDTWRALYELARQFAAEAGVRPTTEAFAVNDPCPLCQQEIGADAARRLAAFDAFVEGRAVQDANASALAVSLRITRLRELTFRNGEDLAQLLAETAAYSPDASALVQRAVTFNQQLIARRDERVRQLGAAQVSDLPLLPESPTADLRSFAARLVAAAVQLRSSDNQSALLAARISELNDQKQLNGQVEEIIARRNELYCLHCYRACETALNTAPLSRLSTALRKDLVSPDLVTRIQEEIAAFALTHVPLKFADESSKGTSFFEMELDSGKRAKKSRVLSEGEQRALSLACFLAETHVAGKRSGIILDDPVTSLDHGRVRRVARRLVDEAAKGRQIIIFTHNLVFYNELMIACVDRPRPVLALPCLIQQGASGEFGVVSVGDEPWVARKVKDRERTLHELIDAIPDGLSIGSDDYKRLCTGYYTALRETWERAVEELVLNDVVRRFGSDVGTMRLGGVEVTDKDFTIIHHAMKRASENSGHDQAAGRQIDVPTKDQMKTDLLELVGFRATKGKAIEELASRRRKLVTAPPRASVGVG